MIRDEQKISTADLYKITIKESNGDVISSLEHPLATETAIKGD
jgi:hypothetical protein